MALLSFRFIIAILIFVMKRMLLILLLVGASFASFAQITQEGRMEFETKEGGIGSTATLGDKGVLVFGPSERASDETWEITRYDVDFELVNKTASKYISRSSFIGHLFTNDGKEVLFVFASKSKIQVIRYTIETANTVTFEAKMKFNASNVYLLNNTLFLQGLIKKSHAIMALNLGTGISKMLILPGQIKTLRIKDVSVDEAQQLVAISVQYGSVRDIQKWQFEIAMYNDAGERVGDAVRVENELGKTTLDAAITWLGKDEFLLSGNYSADRNPLANGLYLASYSNGRQQFIRYHNFADMNNFFQYLKKGKAKERVEKKVAKKKEQGKENAIQVQMVTHSISEFAGQYVLLGEAYYPTYRTVVTTTYVNGSPQTTTRQVFDGYQYTHATILGMDKQGNKLWDHCFEIDIPQKPYYVRRNIRGIMTEKEFRLFYPAAANLKSMIISSDNSIVEKNLGKMQTNKAGDKVKREDLPAVQYWYNDYFLLSGIQRIKNAQEKSKKTRTIYYLAKIKVDSEFNPNDFENEPVDELEEQEED